MSSPTPRPSGGITREGIDDLKRAELTGFALYHLKTDVAKSRDRQNDKRDRFASLKKALLVQHHSVRDEAPRWRSGMAPLRIGVNRLAGILNDRRKK